MKWIVRSIACFVALTGGLVIAGALRPDLPLLGPAVTALRRGDVSRALAAAAPSLAPKRTYWRYTDARGVLQIVASIDDVPFDRRAEAKPMEIETTPLPTQADGVDARAAASAPARTPARSGGGATPSANPVTTYRDRALGAGKP